MFGFYVSQVVILWFTLFTAVLLFISTVIDVVYGIYLKKKSKNQAAQVQQAEVNRQQ